MAWPAFPVAAAVGDFDEATARLVEQWIGFGPAFDGARFAAIGPEGHQVPGQVEQQIFPQGSPQSSIGRLSQRRTVPSRRVHRDQSESARQTGGAVLQPAGHSGAVDQRRQERHQMDSPVLSRLCGQGNTGNHGGVVFASGRNRACEPKKAPKHPRCQRKIEGEPKKSFANLWSRQRITKKAHAGRGLETIGKCQPI